jgi:peptidoglycan DL-endopeptidase CwlO
MTKLGTVLRTVLLAGGVASFVAISSAFAAETTPTGPATQTPTTKMRMHAAMQHHGMLSHRRIEAVQQALNSSGDKIKVDGIWGMKTEAALKQFQEQHHLKVTGRLDRATDKQMHGGVHSA